MMMPRVINLDIDREKLMSEGFKARRINNAIKASLFAMAARWHREMLMDHFEPSAFQRYHYTLRRGQAMDPSSKAFKKSYWGRKVRAGRAFPLYRTGEGMLQCIVPKIRGTWKQARVVLPSKFNFKNPRSQVNMRAELTKILPGEAARLLYFGREEFSAALKRST